MGEREPRRIYLYQDPDVMFDAEAGDTACYQTQLVAKTNCTVIVMKAKMKVVKDSDRPVRGRSKEGELEGRRNLPAAHCKFTGSQ